MCHFLKKSIKFLNMSPLRTKITMEESIKFLQKLANSKCFI